MWGCRRFGETADTPVQDHEELIGTIIPEAQNDKKLIYMKNHIPSQIHTLHQ